MRSGPTQLGHGGGACSRSRCVRRCRSGRWCPSCRCPFRWHRCGWGPCCSHSCSWYGRRWPAGCCGSGAAADGFHATTDCWLQHGGCWGHGRRPRRCRPLRCLRGVPHCCSCGGRASSHGGCTHCCRLCGPCSRCNVRLCGPSGRGRAAGRRRHPRHGGCRAGHYRHSGRGFRRLASVAWRCRRGCSCRRGEQRTEPWAVHRGRQGLQRGEGLGPHHVRGDEATLWQGHLRDAQFSPLREDRCRRHSALQSHAHLKGPTGDGGALVDDGS
mmetsp:Transcript_143676/g.364712  ORF Transcript_143676/g.364712 Transcript_143676/m.364712 type:complete len:270 (+) Transcript_143676:187-996(+)